MVERRVPASTYRLQVTAPGEGVDLFAAAALVPSLHDLGVDWVYLSPILEAEPGSTHGYDVVDHASVDASRGGAAGLAAVADAAHALGMGVLVDIVPNHVGVATPSANAAWWDLLTHGRESRFAEWFDVDWDSGADDVRGKVLVPVVGEGDEGSIEVVPESGSAPGEVRYHEQRFPLAPGTSTLAEQHYALVDWRRGDSELNYRRFFTVTTLAAVRVEDRAVFDGSHVEIRRWFEKGLVDGLRIDHPDGLRDPEGYLRDLAGLTGGAWTVVEKILEPGEELPTAWESAGTTGYDVMGLVDRVLVDPAGQGPLDALDTRLRGGERLDWEALTRSLKRRVADTSLRAEVRRIVRELPPDVVESWGAGPLEDGVAEVLAGFPVYRSYLPEGAAHLDSALAQARGARGDLDGVLDVLGGVLGDPGQPAALRFQQTSGMVMAKGVEDCAFYRWSRLTSLNEVGADPSEFSVTVSEFHEAMARRQAERPRAMTAGTTHDTKRSEDTRARISVLAEAPELWAETLDRLLELAPLPDPAFAGLVWQAVIGVWPAAGANDPDLRSRLHAYVEKAMREAAEHTTWTDPDASYEKAVHAAVDAVFDDAEVRAVVEGLVGAIVDAGWSNALAAKLLTLTVPGVPDVYQGTEGWALGLVDPDNRRPVDHAARAAVLARVDAEDADARLPVLVGGVADPGEAKTWLVRAALRLRRDWPERFSGYTPIEAEGSAAAHVVAFDRGGAISVVTRLPLGLARAGWGDTTLTLPAGRWSDLVSGRVWDGGVLRLADLLGTHPVALLAVAP